MPLCGTVGQITETRRNASKELSVEWQIRDFFSLSDEVSDWYESPLFSFNDGCWTFVLFPNGHILPPTSGFVILCVKKKDTGPPKGINFTFAIRGSDGSEMKKEMRQTLLNSNDPMLGRKICLRSELEQHKSRLIPDEILNITCDLKTVEDNAVRGVSSVQDASIQTDEECREQNSHPDESQLLDKKGVEEWQKSLLKLLESGKESDVIIKVKGKEFPAHRLLLQARSPVFEAMFNHDMVEKQSGTVTMEDCDPETFPDFLKYVYTGSTEMISTKNVFSLYTASDKYDLNALKEECVEFMKRNLTVASFCDVIALAVKYDEKELIRLATEYFCTNPLDIVKTAQWQTFLAENPTVGNELYILSYSQKK